MDPALSLAEIRKCRERLASHVLVTPIHHWKGTRQKEALGDIEPIIKLELFQFTGSFKPRGALNVCFSLSQEQLGRGITTVSSGNHAIATAFAAAKVGSRAKVVMAKSASPVRVELARRYGAEIVVADDVKAAFETMEAIVRDEGLTLVHPFEGPLTAQGTATIALEFHEQAGPLDLLILAIGGGGLCGGMAAAIKQLQPACLVVGVEPEGADTMYRSFAAGEPVQLDKVQTIADSLAPPMALPYSYGLCRDHVDELVRISDTQMQDAMRLLFQEVKLAVEPAGAAATAALAGPLKGRFDGRRVGILACGGNIDARSFANHVEAAEQRASSPADAAA
jgi:threonine dehydratase